MEPEDDLRQQFRTWYQRKLPRLFNFVSYGVSDRATAEDLTASICEQALRALWQYDPQRGTLDVWIFGIARHTLRNYFRMSSRRPRTIPLERAPEIRGSSPSLEEAQEQAEAFRAVVQHLPQLAAQEQEVIALRYGASLSNVEVAKLMGISANQVGVVHHRALHKLRRSMEEVKAG